MALSTPSNINIRELTKRGWARILYLVIFIGLIVVLSFKVPVALRSRKYVFESNPVYDILTFGCAFVTYLAAAGGYYFLAMEKIKFSRTWIVQWAATTINRVLPAGIGSIGTNYIYLKKQGHTVWQATTMVSINNIIGNVADVVLIIIALIFFPLHIKHFKVAASTVYLLLGAIVIILITAAIVLPKIRKHIPKIWINIKKELQFYKQRPMLVVYAFLCSFCLSLANGLGLFLSMRAFGIDLSFGSAVIAFSFRSCMLTKCVKIKLH